MPYLPQSSLRNSLLSLLSPSDFGLLKPNLEPVALEVKDVLVEPNKPIEHVHFIESGLGSIVAISVADERIEVGHVGREGMTATAVILGADQTPILTFVQVAGSALRLRADALEEALEASASLRRLLNRYVQSVMIQMAHTALANGRFTISERLARWLLMYHDRLPSNDLVVTHEFLALMLGVRRPGVTEHLHVLEGEHMIKATRGHIQILDRTKLENLAGDCYGLPEEEYERLLTRARHYAEGRGTVSYNLVNGRAD